MRFFMPLTLLLLGWTVLAKAQSSPAPVITDYDNSALADSLWPGNDSAFCKGSSFTIHGQYFKRATGGESWDSTLVFLGSYPGGTRCNVTGILTGGGGTNDRINVSLPEIFIQDTCLSLLVIKKTTDGTTAHQYLDTANICLTGDYASVSYSDTVFCVGNLNPLPAITLSDSTNGTFCCAGGAPGFLVMNSGEIPLHQGAVGENNFFSYYTDHPFCGDSLYLEIDVRNPPPSVATYNGLSSTNFCQNAPANPVADTALLDPSNGWFWAPTGLLVLADSLSGEIDLSASQPGTHSLLYLPPDKCHDTVALSITISAPATAQIIYPSIQTLSATPQLCQNDPVATPVFNAGNPGGTFLSVPAGINFGSLGEIDPAQSLPGTYDICYLPPGWCADTVRVINGLVIDSVPQTAITLTATQICQDDTLSLASLTGPSGGTLQLFINDTLCAQTQDTFIPLGPLSLSPPVAYEVRYISPNSCADTARASGIVLPASDPTFSYPPFNSFCINDPDPWPLVSGTGGGVFRAITANTIVDPDGRLHLQASGPGQHEVRYVTAGPCPDSLDVTVWIISAASANFSYSTSVFCKSDSNPWPVLQGTPGGTFTSDSALVIHPDSGWIDLAQSPADTYNVTYALTGNCNVSFSQTVIILPFDSSTSLDYGLVGFCRTVSNPRPVLVGDSAGRFIAGAGLVFANTDSGIVDLARTPPGGPYTVIFDVANPCALDPVDSIWVLEDDNPFFSFDDTIPCQADRMMLPDSVALVGGRFREPTGSVLFDDPGLGRIDLLRSIPGGPYSVFYRTAGDCPVESSISLTIRPRPVGTTLSAHPGSSVCTGIQVGFQALGAGVASYDFQHNGAHVQSLLDLYQTDSLRDGDSIAAIVSTNLGCADTVGMRVEVKPRPTVELLSWPQVATDVEPIDIVLGARWDSTSFDWEVLPIGPVAFEDSTGSTEIYYEGETANIQLLPSMQSQIEPAKAFVAITPTTRGCTGETDTILIDMIPGRDKVYVPGVFTPNGDGLNDTWLIRWQTDQEPSDYTLHLLNRAGGKVLEMHPLHDQWNGDNLPDGVYWWSLRGPNGEPQKQGGLTIRRH